MANLAVIGDRHYLWRLLPLLLPGVVVAGLLTYFMYMLIESTEQRLDDSKRVQILDFVRVMREEVSERKNRKPERPVASEAPPAPPTPSADTARDFATNVMAVSDIPAGTDAGSLEFGSAFGMGDGEYLPIVKVTPVYPMQALMRSIEGNCVVEYTVTSTGTVRDVVVIENQCDDSVFYDVSIEATKKFKYKPRVIDGTPIEVPGVRNMFIFEIDESM
jgi:protein TonB